MIGQALTREIFKREPRVLHVLDISENNIAELVRNIHSTLGNIKGDFRTFAIDSCKPEFGALMQWSGGYDYILNLSALKHVRSEKDSFTLMRTIEVNILNTRCDYLPNVRIKYPWSRDIHKNFLMRFITIHSGIKYWKKMGADFLASKFLSDKINKNFVFNIN